MKMKKWTRKQVKEFVTSPEWKKSMDDIDKRMQEHYEEQKQRRAEFMKDYVKIMFTPMGI